MFKHIIKCIFLGLADCILMFGAAAIGNLITFKLSPNSNTIAMFIGIAMAIFAAVYVRFNHLIRLPII